MRKGVKVFTLPGQEITMEELLNNDLIEVTNETVVPCPKEGIILVYVRYNDNREKGAL